MGLASKLAAAGGAAYMAQPSQQQGPPAGAYPGQQGGYNPQNQQAYGQNQYQAYPGGQPGPPQGYQPQQGNYSQPPQQYGQPPSQFGGGPQKPPSAYMQMLQEGLREKNLNPSMFPRLDLNAIANAAPGLIGSLLSEWNVPKELLDDITVLGLYDIIIFVDNSGSMRFEEDGERIKDLSIILNRAALAATKFDADGISLRFMNRNSASAMQLDGIRNPRDIERLLGGNGQQGQVQFTGLTPLGSELKNQVLDPMITPRLRNRSLEKPVLVIIITDGQPAGESRDTLRNAISATLRDAEQAYGQRARPVSFQIAQVGNDTAARKFLNELDDDPAIGDAIDCTSNYENESTEFQRTQGQEMSPEVWVMKLLLGAVNRGYDVKDETRGANVPRPPPPQGGYGQPPQGNFNRPPQGPPYPQQNQQQYNRPPPGPPYPQQGYGGQQGGYPPQGQGGYPPQGNYPPSGQGGGYGAPPPPPRY